MSFFLIPITLLSVPQPTALDHLVGTWRGTRMGSGLSGSATIRVRRECAIYVIDLEREELIIKCRERIYLEVENGKVRAVSDPDYVPAARRDRGEVNEHHLSLNSDPWEVGLPKPMKLSWSLSLGEFREAVKSRLYIDTPTFHPNRNLLTLSWTGDWGQGGDMTRYRFVREETNGLLNGR